ncbi:MAG: NUDIX domain-containing protein [Gammaproteobacteria bacterium]|nr:NUDIX domain-containing protein [Gammaproteobacteria bacterium]
MSKAANPPSRNKLSAGAVIVRNSDDKQWLFLLLRAYRNWDFPKGMIDHGEAPLAAAQREVEEETGLQDISFTWGADYVETAPYNRGKVARYYLAETTSSTIELKINPEIGHAEHHEYRWMNLFELKHTLSPRLQPVMAWALNKLKL